MPNFEDVTWNEELIIGHIWKTCLIDAPTYMSYESTLNCAANENIPVDGWYVINNSSVQNFRPLLYIIRSKGP